MFYVGVHFRTTNIFPLVYHVTDRIILLWMLYPRSQCQQCSIHSVIFLCLLHPLHGCVARSTELRWVYCWIFLLYLAAKTLLNHFFVCRCVGAIGHPTWLLGLPDFLEQILQRDSRPFTWNSIPYYALCLWLNYVVTFVRSTCVSAWLANLIVGLSTGMIIIIIFTKTSEEEMWRRQEAPPAKAAVKTGCALALGYFRLCAVDIVGGFKR